MATLTSITITGADDRTDPADLIELAEEFPFVEWGVLFSAKRTGQSRYPSLPWIMDLAEKVEATWTRWQMGTRFPYHMKLAAHLCGAMARETQAGRPCWARMLNSMRAFGRVQINGFDFAAEFDPHGPRHLEGCFTYILQARSSGDLSRAPAICGRTLASISVLSDPSGGLGKVQTEWPDRPERVHLGYAGGIGPSNIASVASTLIKRSPCSKGFWLDMESGVRTDDRFDLKLVRKTLEAVKPFIRSEDDNTYEWFGHGSAYETACPECGDARVSHVIQDDPFRYGATNTIELVAKGVRVWTCANCGFRWTASDAERAHDKAVEEYQRTHGAT